MSTSVRRVLYVVSRFPSVSATFTAYEMAAMVRKGVDVQVASVWKATPTQSPHEVEKPFLDTLFTTRLADPGLWLRALQVLIQQPALFGVLFQLFRGHLVSVYAVLKFFASVPKGLVLGHWVQRQEFDVLHAHFLTTPATVALIASKVSGVPYTVTIHAFDIYTTDAKSVNGGVRAKCEHAAANVIISKFGQTYITERWPGLDARFELIYNGIDLSLFTPGERAPIDPSVSPVRILSNGRLIEKKGHNYLIRAVGKLREDGVPVTLSIIGNGPQEDDLRDLVRTLGLDDHVHFLGTMTQKAVIDHYRTCDLFVLACAVASNGDMDGLPTVLIESLALEIPSVSTQVSGVPEIIVDGETGLCVPPHDVDALAGAIRYMIEHPDAAQQMAKQGRTLVESRFDRQKNADVLYDLWKDIL